MGEETENLNRLIINSETKSVIKKKKKKKNSQQTKVLGQKSSQVNSTKHLEKS